MPSLVPSLVQVACGREASGHHMKQLLGLLQQKPRGGGPLQLGLVGGEQLQRGHGQLLPEQGVGSSYLSKMWNTLYFNHHLLYFPVLAVAEGDGGCGERRRRGEYRG